MLRVLRMFPFSQAAIKVNSGSGDPKVSKGRSESPLVASAEAKPLLAGKTSYGRKSGCSVAPIWRDNVELRERAAWGRSCGSAKLLAGTLRCLHLCWLLPLNWSPAEQLGRCPKPHKGRCPLTLQGADEKGRSPPLDPFFAPRLERARLIVRNCCPYPKSASRTRRCPARHHAPPSPSNPVSDPHTRGLSPPKSSHCPTISAGTSQF